jgi:UDP-N-acetylmuramoyl-L-alanyl-D-glutamate--2,6-diaminopimelate ligase
LPGALFICLRGQNFDGHDLISQAAENGAAAVLIDAKFSGEISSDVGIVRVENTREAMALVSANFYGRPAEKLRLIGVTGTNGKTTTTYFIEEILRNCGRRTGLIGTVGLRALGEPLDIPFATDTTPDPPELHFIFAKMLEMGVQDVVMEVSSHALALCKMTGITFDVGVFTNLTQDHLDFHGTMENYARAKAQLFCQSNFAVVNADDSYSKIMLEHNGDAPFYTYSIDTPANFRALHTVCEPLGSTFELDAQAFSIPVGGKFNVYNVLAAIGTATALGVELPRIKEAVGRLGGVPGRIQSVPNERGLNIFVDYAHTPDGLENIITSVRETTAGRVITLFGCGGDRDKTKRPIMGEIAARLSDYCILTSDNPRTEDPFEILAQVEEGVKQSATQYEVLENRRDAIFAGVKMLQPQDALIIAGKGHEDYQIIGTTKHHFDDFETATEAAQ